ncbi:class I adenylate-forming enzyme family protein [Actinomycetes bacterium M1A6_2h]
MQKKRNGVTQSEQRINDPIDQALIDHRPPAPWSATGPGLGHLIAANAQRNPSGLAVADHDGERLGWGQFDEQSTRAARWLLNAGLVAGDRILAVVDERSEYLVLHAAAMKAGLVIVPGSWRFTATELALLLTDSRARATVSVDVCEEAVAAALELSGVSVTVRVSLGVTADRTVNWSRLIDDEVTSSPFEYAAGDTLAYLAYTSGTTGAPKGAMLSQGAVITAARIAAQTFQTPYHGVNVMSGSLSFLSAVVAHFWSQVVTGSGTVLLGKYAVDAHLDALVRHRATFTYAPTPVIASLTALMREHPDGLADLKCINIGASPIAAGLKADFVETAGSRVCGVYGLTEAAGVPLLAGRIDDWQKSGVGYDRVGRVVPPSSMLLLDGDGREVPRDGSTVGEICVSAPMLMSGYWNNSAATKTTVVGGWLRTGDLGSITEDGYVGIEGRLKDLIVSGGMNVYPAEIERVIQADSNVEEAAVVGSPHERWGETPVAFVKLASGLVLDRPEDYVAALCRRALAGFKQPTRIIVVEEMPRNPNGKILKRNLASQLVIGTNEE